MREFSVCGRIIPVYKPEYKAALSSALEYDSADCTLSTPSYRSAWWEQYVILQSPFTPPCM